MPFCHLSLRAKKPRDFRYPSEIRTLGDQLRARRLDLRLRQKEVAKMLGACEDSVVTWK
jgi:hypothetical protein